MAETYNGPADRVSLNRGSTSAEIRLPNGACGFRELRLASGVQAPTCGCRRFWLNNTAGDGQYCFCGHHACYHESEHENARPMDGPGRAEPLQSPVDAFPSTHQADKRSQPAAWIPPTWSELIGEHDELGKSGAGRSSGAPGSVAGLGIRNSQPQSLPRSINTRLWQTLNGFARVQDSDRESNHSSIIPSTAVPSLCDEPQTRNMPPPVFIPNINPHDNHIEAYSATEVATPSARGTPDFRSLAPPSKADPRSPSQHRVQSSPASQAINRQDHAIKASQPTPQPTVSVGPSLSIQEMCNTIQNYGQRINLLEGISFGHMPSHEVQERFDLVDGRLLDLEVWRKDADRAGVSNDTEERLDRMDARLQEFEDWRVDKENEETSQESGARYQFTSAGLRRQLETDTSSCASDGSFDENAAVQTETVVLATLAAHAETGPRIDALEFRLSELEDAAPPTFARPWHVQIVLLPFGRQLPGIWFSSTESTRRSISSSTQASEEWTGIPMPTTTSFHSVNSSGAWTTESIEAWAHDTHDEWLSPKACGPSGTVFQRLASRGLVQNIALRSSEARHVWNAIAGALSGIPQATEEAPDVESGQYLGLKERFIPLRKVRKSSRLRFLSRAEMATPATWTADFLDASVFMRVGEKERRLYLTTPEGYVQPARPCWTWPALRNLASCDVGEIQQAQAAGKIVEACWTHNAQLDSAASLPSSFTSSQERPWGTAHADDRDHSHDTEDAAMLSPAATRTSYLRSASLPGSEPAFPRGILETENVPKRRVTSFELENSSRADHQEYITKRRRISTSPELERRGVNFTPRWSREPPSPFTADDIAMARSSQAPSSRARATTPFAYATPHSHFGSRNSGDTGVDDVDDAGLIKANDIENGEEWEGVEEQERTDSEGSFNDGDY